MRRPATTLLTAALLVVAAGCGGTDAPGAAPPPSPSSTGSTATSTQDVDGGYGNGNGLGLVDVQTSSADGVDRVTFVLDGEGTPGYWAGYVDQAVADGSGEVVPLGGDATLQVVLRGLGLPFDTGIPAYGDMTTRVPGTGGVAEVAPGGVFEGDQSAWVGLTGGPRPFTVSVLDDPVRVVVEVATV